MEKVLLFSADIYYSFKQFPLTFQLAMMLTVLLLSIYLLLFVKNLIIKKQENKSLQKIKPSNLEYHQNIKTILFSPQKHDLEAIKKVFEGNQEFKKKVKLIVTQIITELIEDNGVYNKENYNELVRFFDLKSFWEKKLQKGKVKNKIEALSKIINLKLAIRESVIISLANHNNVNLRNLARKAHIVISKNDPFLFFNEDFSLEFTEIDKKQLHETLLMRSKEYVPNFAQWIKKADNNDLKCFFIYETAFYKQVDNLPLLLTLLTQTTMPKVRKELINAIEILQNSTLEDELIVKYDFEPLSVQQKIIKQITETKPSYALEFLESAFHKSNDTSLKISIGKAIYNFDNSGKRIIIDMESRINDNFEKLIFEHIKESKEVIMKINKNMLSN